MFKRGVSPVVATVLLLVLTVVIAGVVFSVVLPFVNKSLGSSKACLDIFEGVEFPESKFNCYNITTTTDGNETGFSVKVNKEGISGFRVSLIDVNENSDVFDIKNATKFNNLKMIRGSYNGDLEFPSVGGQRTYITKGIYSKAEISPIAESGDICAVADRIEFMLCAKDVVF